jgi:orotidine-5'-phosphate decarboxylase
MTLEDSERIIVALDVDSATAADAVIDELAGRVGAFKVGLQLFSAAGPQYVRRLTERGIKVFLDLKFHDIPNTVAKSAVEASKLGVWMLNVHASGGREMMERTVQEVASQCERKGTKKPLIIAVTVLTSSSEETLREIGISNDVEQQVGNLARLAAVSNMDGVVASPREVAVIRSAVLNPDFLTVTPGIRPKAGTLDDQKRVTTFGQALANGSDYVVIGRPITQASNRVAAVEQILSEVEH